MKKIFISTILFSGILISCSKDHDSTPSAGNGHPLTAADQAQVVDNYATILEAGYQDAYNAALTMQSSIKTFIANPTEQGLTDAKTAWLAAREPYMQTEMARFYGGPIDGDSGDVLLNSWPLDEGYIDYLVGDSHAYQPFNPPHDSLSGIINNPSINITEDYLMGNNQLDGGTTNANGDNVDVSAGYHAIEFLLWGQDATPASQKIPGQRSYKDYLTTADATGPNGARRAEYIQIVTQLVVDNLKEMVDAWAPNVSTNYRASFEKDIPTAISNIFLGIGSLAKGEMSGERMSVPLALHAQEQEHSCFSDNTHRDLWLDMQGIANAYNGTYVNTAGTTIGKSQYSLSAYVQGLNVADDKNMQDLLSKAQASLKAIEDNEPFDWLIDSNNPSGNQIVATGVTAVGAVADGISAMAKDINLDFQSVPEEND
ncbi:MAG TPA: imelysin family protein [Arachidicoccus sp.]